MPFELQAPPEKVPMATPLPVMCPQLLVVSDLFTERSQFEMMYMTLTELRRAHPAEDEILLQYLVPATCKAAAVLGMVSRAPPAPTCPSAPIKDASVAPVDCPLSHCPEWPSALYCHLQDLEVPHPWRDTPCRAPWVLSLLKRLFLSSSL